MTTERNWFEKGGVAFAGKLGGGMEVVLVTHVVAFPELLVTTCCLVMLLLWLEARNTWKNRLLLIVVLKNTLNNKLCKVEIHGIKNLHYINDKL